MARTHARVMFFQLSGFRTGDDRGEGPRAGCTSRPRAPPASPPRCRSLGGSAPAAIPLLRGVGLSSLGQAKEPRRLPLQAVAARSCRAGSTSPRAGRAERAPPPSVPAAKPSRGGPARARSTTAWRTRASSARPTTTAPRHRASPRRAEAKPRSWPWASSGPRVSGVFMAGQWYGGRRLGVKPTRVGPVGPFCPSFTRLTVKGTPG